MLLLLKENFHQEQQLQQIHIFNKCETSFQGIRRCNIGLENIDKVNMDKKKQNVFRGEIYFLRGFLYNTIKTVWWSSSFKNNTFFFWSNTIT